jgi:hypothetical protein
MCYSNCPYERWDGSCKGCRSLNKGQPHCADDDEYIEALAARDDLLCDRQDWHDNMREERRISNR